MLYNHHKMLSHYNEREKVSSNEFCPRTKITNLKKNNLSLSVLKIFPSIFFHELEEHVVITSHLSWFLSTVLQGESGFTHKLFINKTCASAKICMSDDWSTF